MASIPPEFDPQQMSQRMKDSAQHIWLAGLGAFAKAQEEGGKVFENLVKEGSHLQQTTQQAQAKMTEAAEKMGQMASGQMDKLEGIFEERVAKALKSMGLPSAEDVAALQARVEQLEKQLAERKS
ncbi:MAG: poly granule associated family protein [Betaproteobacteria bacterium]|nr:poly granule associated family protein [Betaproteobacteria bacterium]NBY34106.1 poly granule associated family protein [Betaproteobacteria bacterium]NDF05300.1 poly granule associated family protein [Betaproteobacteria bacterium]